MCIFFPNSQSHAPLLPRPPHTPYPTHPINNPQSLALRNLSPLEGLFEPSNRLAIELFSRGDDNLEFTAVSGHERVEIGKDFGGGSETAILREDGEEVGEDGGGG